MMVGNDITYDTRIYKTALALADGGLQVTVLAYSPTGVRRETSFGPVRIIRVPVRWALRNRQAAHRRIRQERKLIPNARVPGLKETNKLKYALRDQEAQILGGASLLRRAQAQRLSGVLSNGSSDARRALARREDAWRDAFSEWIETQTAFASWRRILPQIDDYTRAYLPVLQEEDWDILHAHDVHHMGLATLAVARRRAEGKPAQWVYDAHEYVRGLALSPPRTARQRAAWVDLESEYIHRADAVITVTGPLAEEIQRQYSLPETPAVVMNSSLLADQTRHEGEDIRSLCELPAETPLLVYSGGVTHARGVHTVVEALAELPGVHLAVVCVPNTRTARAQALMARARDVGVEGRLHLVEPVAPSQVSAFLATADVGTAPFLHFGSHEFALPNKLFEYLHAGLPLVVSDCRAQAQFVREKNVGAVFPAEDARACAQALREVLDRRHELRRRIFGDRGLLEPYSWERQAASLRGLYRRLLGDPETVKEPLAETPLTSLREAPNWRDDRSSVVAIGPSNQAGQAWGWAKALERELPGVTTKVVAVDRGTQVAFPADETVSRATYRTDTSWGQRLEDEAIEGWTHVLLESGRPLFGLRNGQHAEGDAKLLLGRGVRVGLVLHGLESRDPARHAATTPWSPFTDSDDALTALVQSQVDSLQRHLRAFADLGPVFASTPDLLDHIPGSIWLPVVVDTERWKAAPSVLAGLHLPIVAHIARRNALRVGSTAERALTDLRDRGVVQYRRYEDVPPDQVPALVAEADIVVDQLTLGSYGVGACEAMAAERVVLGHVLPAVREAVRAVSGVDLPIVEASPATIEDVILGVLADPVAARERGAAGRLLVQALHDGRYSARVLREHMGLRGEAVDTTASLTALAAVRAQSEAAAQLTAAARIQAQGA